MALKTGGQAVVDSLLNEGVSQAFGVISVHTVDIYDALFGARDRLKFVGGRHESAVTYMADGYSRASGRPGVCLTSTGPGAANSIGAMGEAYQCSSAVLNIASNCESDLINSLRGALHEPKDQLGMFRSVTAWNALVDTPAAIPGHIHQAFQSFVSGRPRPVELEFPTDVLGRVAEIGTVAAAQRVPLPGSTADIERAASLLAQAKRPLLWAGAGVISSDATPEFVKLAELLGAPMTTSYGGKGAMPDDHALAVGCSIGGRVYGRNPVFDFMAKCDVALVVGASLPYRITAGTGLKLPPTLIHADIDDGVFNRNYRATATVRGDAKTVLGQLVAALEGRRLAKSEAYAREVQDLRRRVLQSLWDSGANQQRVMATIREAVARDAIIVADPTMAAYWATRGMPCYEPRTYIAPHGWTSIGFAFPAALGAKAARPDRQVVVISGDGGFQLNLQELGTAAQHGINVIVLLFNDGAWGVLRDRQRDYFGGRYFATDLTNPDFAKLTAAYGLASTRVQTIDELSRALSNATGRDEFHLIDIRTPHGFSEFV
jgi:thiamine pyrophosphate-dependent acetolactate synthase large subunit-like protein